MGSPKSFVSDRDSRFMGAFWKEFSRMVETQLIPSTIYHPKTDGKIERVNQWLEGYLRNYVGEQQKAWEKWLHLGEFFYDTTFHMSIGMSPFK